MTHDDIIRTAKEAGLTQKPFCRWGGYLDDLMRFAALVAAEKDREIKRLQDILYEQLGELTALRAEKQMRGYIKQL